MEKRAAILEREQKVGAGNGGGTALSMLSLAGQQSPYPE